MNAVKFEDAALTPAPQPECRSDADLRMRPSSYYDRIVDVMEELVKFTLLTDAPQPEGRECPRCGSVGGFGCYECIPQPSETVAEPREFWIEKLPGELPSVWGHYPDLAKHPDYQGEVIHVIEKSSETVAEALHNLIACAEPYMRDEAQMLALSEARAALRALKGGA